MGKVACISNRKMTGEFFRRVVVSFSPFSSPESYNVAEREETKEDSAMLQREEQHSDTHVRSSKKSSLSSGKRKSKRREKRVKPASLLECLAKRSEISECSQHQRAYARQIGPKSSFHLAPDRNALLNIRASSKKKEKRVKASHFAIERRRRWSWWWKERKEEEKKAKKKLESQEMKCCASFQSHSFVLRWNSYKFEAL